MTEQGDTCGIIQYLQGTGPGTAPSRWMCVAIMMGPALEGDTDGLCANGPPEEEGDADPGEAVQTGTMTREACQWHKSP